MRKLKSKKTQTQPIQLNKRTGVEAIKLHLYYTDGKGRSSQPTMPYTARRPSSMATIKEYPFDLSDLKNGDETKMVPPIPTPIVTPSTPVTTPSAPPTIPTILAPVATHQVANSDGKRKVSIMADEKGHEQKSYERSRTFAADGPVRRKSSIHHTVVDNEPSLWERSGVATIEGRFKKNSSASSIYSKRTLPPPGEIETSWWFACCKKCHQDDSGIPSWEPPNWRKICPYPLCPSYRVFAQTISLVLIGILSWITVWTILGETAAPGGQLFGLVVLAIAAHFGGWLMVKITTLPALIGMLIVGIIMKNLGFVNLDGDFAKVTSEIRKFALTIILTRAGLDLDPNAMRRLFVTVLKLSLVPWCTECIIIAVCAHFFLGLPWMWGILLGSIMAAVSPAVVVPCLFRLRGKGYGVAKGIPTLVLAVSAIDDAASVAGFGIIKGIMFSSYSFTYNIVTGPLSIIAGIAFGVICGYLAKYIPERNDPFVVPLRVLLLLTGGLLAILGSEEIGWGGAGPLAVIAFAFVACMHWSKMGWDIEDNPVATAFEIFWMIFEPLLFGVTGAAVVISELDANLVLIGGGVLMGAVVIRIFVTAGVGFGSNLNTKEKFFVGLSWMAKATVQAALGSVALDSVHNGLGTGDEKEVEYGEIVQMLCILSIILTAPLGAIIITLSGPRLLTKTTKPQILEGWRRSHRPSIRDISIIDEDELAEREVEAANRNASAHTPAPPTTTPPPPITVQPNHTAHS